MNSTEPLVTLPRSASSRLEMAFSVVDLPAPLAPSRATMPPLGTRQRHALQHQDDVIVDHLDVVECEHRPAPHPPLWTTGPPGRRRCLAGEPSVSEGGGTDAAASFLLARAYDDGHCRGVILFSSANFFADSSIIGRTTSRIGSIQSETMLPLLAVPLLDQRPGRCPRDRRR